MSEYSMMVQTAELKPGIADMTTNEVSQSLSQAFGQAVSKAAQGANTVAGGGWEILSHEITRLDRHLVVSFLLKRD